MSSRLAKGLGESTSIIAFLPIRIKQQSSGDEPNVGE
jgi:hypothetical protein